MTFDTVAFHEGIQPLGRIPAASYTTAQNTSWVPVRDHNRVVAILSPNVVSATGTLDMRIQCARDGSGTGAIDMPGKAITQITAGTQTREWIIEVMGAELPAGFTHIRAVVTPAVAASTLSALVLGVSGRNEPVAQANWAQVVKPQGV